MNKEILDPTEIFGGPICTDWKETVFSALPRGKDTSGTLGKRTLVPGLSGFQGARELWLLHGRQALTRKGLTVRTVAASLVCGHMLSPLRTPNIIKKG